MTTVYFKAQRKGQVQADGSWFQFHPGDEFEYVSWGPQGPTGYRFVYVNTPFGEVTVSLDVGDFELRRPNCGDALCPAHGDPRDTSVREAVLA